MYNMRTLLQLQATGQTVTLQPSKRFPTGRYDGSWWQLYAAAMFEPDERKVQHRIRLASDAIKTRRLELNGVEGNDAEIRALEDAMNALSVLQRTT